MTLVSFCQTGLAESVNLDYKREFPSGEKLARTVSAFANTSGGLVIIGIDEDDESRPRRPFHGLAFEPKLEERVWNILTEHVQPLVFPEVQVCQPHDGRTFVVIRITTSATSPHAIRNSTSVYLRVGNITRPEEAERLATVSELEWLRDRRRQSEGLKHVLVSRAYERCATVRDLQGFEAERPKVHVWLGPKFPTGPLITLAELDSVRRVTKLRADNYAQFARVHEGITHVYKGERDIETFTETNVFGYTFHSAGITSLKTNKPRMVFLSLIVDAVADVVRFSSKFLPATGFWGELELHVTLRNVRESQMIGFDDTHFVAETPQIDDSFEITRDLRGFIWRDDAALAAAVAEILTSIVWAFGGIATIDAASSHLAQCREWTS